MSQNWYTGPEFAAKCDWEGGVLEAMFGYGLYYPDALDPKVVASLPTEVHQAFCQLESAREAVRIVKTWVDEQLGEYEEDDDAGA